MFLNLTHSSSLRALNQNFDVLSIHSSQPNTHCEARVTPARGISALFTGLLVILFACLPAAMFGAKSTGAAGVLTSPAPAGTLPGSSVTFQWSAGTNVAEYCLHLNTQPGNPDDPSATRIYASGKITGTSVTVNNVPTNGTALYAILGSEYNGSWHYVTYSYTEASPASSGVPALSLSTASLAFGSVALNTPTSQAVTLSSTGTAAVTVNAGAIAGSGFTVSGATFPLTLNPGQTAALSVQFDPTVAGAATGALTLTSNSSTGSSVVVSLSGTGTGVPVISGLTCASGSMTSAGTDNCTVTLSSPAQSGGFLVMLGSSSSAVTVPSAATVASGSSSSVFAATVTAVSSAQSVTLTAYTNGVSVSYALQLGAASQALSVNTTAISFGDVNLNSPSTQSVTLTSTGTASVTISAATVAGTGFSLAGAALPITLAPNQTATLSVQFDPTAAGAATGSLTIASTSSANPTVAVSLTGTGESTAYEVNLSWNAPSSSTDPVAGYNVYRAPSGSTSYQQINTSMLTQTEYTDTSVQDGQTYDYIVESVDDSGATSAPSNMASLTIPQ
jgi:Abnormal spindle-like microcephaly-assoc'd, ASPM-SPD-2-Hydin